MVDEDTVQYVVVVNRNSGYDQYFYVGDSELSTLGVLRRLKIPNIELVKTTVKMGKMFGYKLIQSILVVEKIS